MIIFCMEFYFEVTKYIWRRQFYKSKHISDCPWPRFATLVLRKSMLPPCNVEVWKRIFSKWALSEVNVSIPVRTHSMEEEAEFYPRIANHPIYFCYVFLIVAPSSSLFLSPLSQYNHLILSRWIRCATWQTCFRCFFLILRTFLVPCMMSPVWQPSIDI